MIRLFVDVLLYVLFLVADVYWTIEVISAIIKLYKDEKQTKEILQKYNNSYKRTRRAYGNTKRIC